MTDRYRPINYDTSENDESGDERPSAIVSKQIGAINFRGTGFDLPYVKAALCKLLSASPAFLLAPNNLQHYSDDVKITKIEAHGLTRNGLRKYMEPILLLEAGNDLSLELNHSDLFIRDIYFPKEKPSVQAGVDVTLYCKMSEIAFKGYLYSKSNCFWMLSKNKNFSLFKTFMDPNHIESNVITVAIRTFSKYSYVETGNIKLATWPDLSGKFPAPSDKLLVVKFDVTFSVTPSTVSIYWSIQPNDKLNLIYVGKISQFLRTHRMLGITEFDITTGVQPKKNLSVLYDALINPHNFAGGWDIGGQIDIETKFEYFSKSSGPAVLVIAGGPATGKTTLWMKLIQSYYSKNNACKILICASSNYVTDKLFLLFRQKIPNANMFRVGKVERTNKTVATQCALALNEFKAKNKPGTKGNHGYGCQNSVETELIKASNFLFVTLGSCQQPTLTNIRNDMKFDMFVGEDVDQAKAPELLFPLYFTSLKRMLLVGDPNRMNSVFASYHIEEKPKEETLIFNRLCSYLKKEKTCAIEILYEQYRMQPRVMELFNSLSYTNGYRLTKGVSEKYEKTEHHAQILSFSDQSWYETQTAHPPSYFNEKEAEFAIEFIKASHLYTKTIEKILVDKMQYAIICAYSAQIDRFKDLIKAGNIQAFTRVYSFDQAPSVDADIIVISGVRSTTEDSTLFSRNARQLSVAISRGACICVLSKFSPYIASPGWNTFFNFTAKHSFHYSTAEIIKKHGKIGYIIEKHAKLND